MTAPLSSLDAAVAFLGVTSTPTPTTDVSPRSDPQIIVSESKDVPAVVNAIRNFQRRGNEIWAQHRYPPVPPRVAEIRKALVAVKPAGKIAVEAVRATITPDIQAERDAYEAACRDVDTARRAALTALAVDAPTVLLQPPSDANQHGHAGVLALIEELFEHVAIANLDPEWGSFKITLSAANVRAIVGRIESYAKDHGGQIPSAERVIRDLEEFEEFWDGPMYGQDPEGEAGPAPDKRLAHEVWSAILKLHARTDEAVTHADLYNRLEARQESVREATGWLVQAGKIRRADGGGFLPHEDDRE